MGKTTAVGLIGFGEVGRSIWTLLSEGEMPRLSVGAILVRNADTPMLKDIASNGIAVHTDRDRFLADEIDIVAEAAGHAALKENAESVLLAGKDLIALSVGAFADDEFLFRVKLQAERTQTRIVIPSGAVAGLDAIASAARGHIESVVHTTRKNPQAFQSPLFREQPSESPLVLFEGNAREGVRKFPENVNVAAAVALAGIGMDRTVLRVIADPSVKRNCHQVEVTGDFGRLVISIENEPSSNPKTGRLVALSMVRTLEARTASLVFGG